MDDFNWIRFQLAAFGGSAASNWQSHVKAEMRRKDEQAKLGEVYIWPEFTKWIDAKNDQAEEEECGNTASAGILATTGATVPVSSPPLPGCLICGTAAAHKSASCSKVPDLSNNQYFDKCVAKNWCKRCVQAVWTPAHACQCCVTWTTCGKNHISACHRFAVAATTERSKERGNSGHHNKPDRGCGDKQQQVEPSHEGSREPSILEKRLEKLEEVAASNSQPIFKRESAESTTKRAEPRKKDLKEAEK